MTDIITGYGRGEVEPKIAPLVEAVRRAEFSTFSSCEGHVDGELRSIPRFTCVAFYAPEDQARLVHERLLQYRDRLACSWEFTARFVLHRETNEWTLGWSLENYGVIASGDDDTFVARTVNAGWADIPLLVDMFDSLRKTNSASLL